MRHLSIWLTAGAALLLTGCSPAEVGTAQLVHPPYSPITALVAVDAISMINTQKTMEDHVISLVTGKDCSLLKASHGYPYCTDTTPPPSVMVTSYCYRSLAKVSCFDHKIPSDVEQYYGARTVAVPVAQQ